MVMVYSFCGSWTKRAVAALSLEHNVPNSFRDAVFSYASRPASVRNTGLAVFRVTSRTYSKYFRTQNARIRTHFTRVDTGSFLRRKSQKSFCGLLSDQRLRSLRVFRTLSHQSWL